jgi:hypothetical protein
MKADTRVLISRHEGGRTADDATELFSDIERKRNPDSPMPLFISDEWMHSKKDYLTYMEK